MTVLQASRLLLRVLGEEDADFMLKLFFRSQRQSFSAEFQTVFPRNYT